MSHNLKQSGEINMAHSTAVSMKQLPMEALPVHSLEAESAFYRNYAWCLDAVPTVGVILERLREEFARFGALDEPWQRTEVAKNIFLLACAVSDTLDDFLLGSSVDFSRIGGMVPGGRRVGKFANHAVSAARSLRLKKLGQWRAKWQSAVEDYLEWQSAYLGQGLTEPSGAGANLLALSNSKLPADFTRRRARIPAAFRSQDLTHFDISKLGSKFAAEFPDRGREILVIGLRTAGSYFAPFLRAYLKLHGFQSINTVTLRPKRGIAPWERERLIKCASQGGLAIIVDEPVGTGATLAKAIGILHRTGIAHRNVAALFPIHPTGRDWNRSSDALVLSTIRVLTLEPEEWYKHQRLEPATVQERVTEYFQSRGYRSAQVVISNTSQQLNQGLQLSSDEGFHTRLKRVYQVELQNASGQAETRYVLAKSVGWGWLSYHAFTIASGLPSFVPPILGLRDGILYMEWVRPNGTTQVEPDRRQLVETAAKYVAERVHHMRLPEDSAPYLNREGRHAGFDQLMGQLIRAYGWNLAMGLKRARVREQLSRPCPYPTLVDGRMRACEWIQDSGSVRKADFEHHGLGKHQLSMTDPAYDLADVVLHWNLSFEEEQELITRYKANTGDSQIGERLLLSKVLAGTHSIGRALSGLHNSRLHHRHQEFNRLYLEARTFLTLQTLRFSSGLAAKPNSIHWANPLVVLDIDGVLDKQIFGYPCTTAAGILAISLLHAHDQPFALNTARTVSQMKQYCRAYGCVGGGAEYGSYVWDATTDRSQVMVCDASLDQMERLRQHLRRTPGIFLNDDYQYSVQAFVYEKNATVPLPTTLIRDLMAELKLDRLKFHQTFTDTTVVASETDKGRGLAALLQLANQSTVETIAVGDSEPDLPMFRTATRSFAPANISCRSTASLLGCEVSEQPYQAGLLQIVRSILHPAGDDCKRCDISINARKDDLFFELLQVADQSRLKRLVRAMLDPMAFRSVADRFRN
jgi:hydroxymethylpyrimidine pyrophosphatase-like HAD family hydrolase